MGEKERERRKEREGKKEKERERRKEREGKREKERERSKESEDGRCGHVDWPLVAPVQDEQG